MTDGKNRVRQDIAAAKKVKPAKRDVSPAKAPSFLMKQYKRVKDDLYYQQGEDKPSIWLASKFEVVADARDDQSLFWHKQVRFVDRSGKEKDKSISQVSIATGEFISTLMSDGAIINCRPEARQPLQGYLNFIEDEKRSV